MGDEKRKGWGLRTILEVVAALATIAGFGLAVMDWREKEKKLDERIVALEKETATKQQVIDEQNRRLRRNLEAFAREYKRLVEDAASALGKVQEFDSEANRREYQQRFAAEWQKRFDEARPKIVAVVSHVHKWRPALQACGQLANGDVNELNNALQRDDPRSIIGRFGVIRSGIDSNIRLLETALDGAAR